jgi:transcriptional regulator
MYIPKAFHIDDLQVIHEFIDSNSFATLVSTVDGVPFATHLPLLCDRTRSPHGVLLGHLARANPQWHAFDGRREALVIFQGPHAYVSPRWYTTTPAVPTWNYTAVHVYGVPYLIEDAGEFSGLLDRLIAFYESGMPHPWPGVLPEDFRDQLMRGIVGFAMDIRRIEGKFKLSQNRSREDQQAVVEQLEASADPVARALSVLTKRHLGLNGRAGGSGRHTEDIPKG